MSTTPSSPNYFTQTLPNGLRVALLPSAGNVVYCGVAIGAGSRHDPAQLPGLAHFAEHTIFKGTTQRKSWHILNRMEVVGGELNAYTTKDETFVYAIAPRGEETRAMELLADVLLHPTFPAHEVEKERDVVCDEINLYKDTPSDQIFDDFEAQLFAGHPLAHPILGSAKSVKKMSSYDLQAYAARTFTAENMVVFVMGDLSPKRWLQLCTSYFAATPSGTSVRTADTPLSLPSTPLHTVVPKSTHQSHTIMGGSAFSLHDPRRLSASILLQYLGGAGMNARLNLLLRERTGWVYSVEGLLVSISDSGWWQVYFGCDPGHAAKASATVHRELDRLMAEGLTPTELRAWKKQLKGQLLVSSEQRESTFLNFGRQVLFYSTYSSISEACQYIDEVTSQELCEVAQHLFAPHNRHSLIYQGK